MSKYGTVIWVGLLALIAGFLIWPPTHKVFVDITARFPYISEIHIFVPCQNTVLLFGWDCWR
ncbi:MAG: hypothetical protein M0P40_05775 [Bacteroidales bacterium]|nr:hypothetical protein [Bacteroidales bacterium]MDD2831899.1 hypothetical protein [Bacteroidales bacterium]MDD3698055.1 hypothetical protein [Bacteroidales bacterium]MDD4168481.1 hypothetical protein [Bacteroidales bacterium]MDD5046762.1 hypothetical protein [Bacteroidales bacterium]